MTSTKLAEVESTLARARTCADVDAILQGCRRWLDAEERAELVRRWKERQQAERAFRYCGHDRERLGR